MKKAVFLDRDGTIIVDKLYLNDPAGVEFIPGAMEALIALKEAGYHFVIATNQSGIPRGIVQIENLNAIHQVIADECAKHGIEFLEYMYAPHRVESNHILRKPNAGMLLEPAEKHGIDLTQSWMVGDRMTDVEAGHRAGAKSIFLNGTEELDTSEFEAPEFVTDTLLEASKFILEHS